MLICMRARRPKQIELFAVARRARRQSGRKRGPKPREERLGFVPHVAREEHNGRNPVHVSIRRVRLAPSFREQRVRAAIVEELRLAKHRGVRVVHYSIQANHIHLMIEGRDGADLSAQMRVLLSRIALMVNALTHRTGSLFRDRHHRRELTSPRATRNALVYILFNDRKHALESGPVSVRILEELDACSSAAWFQGWHPTARPPPDVVARAGGDGPPPVSVPRTWLAGVGWRRGGGALRFDEAPRRDP